MSYDNRELLYDNRELLYDTEEEDQNPIKGILNLGGLSAYVFLDLNITDSDIFRNNSVVWCRFSLWDPMIQNL